jgi:hypothetical protein
VGKHHQTRKKESAQTAEREKRENLKLLELLIKKNEVIGGIEKNNPNCFKVEENGGETVEDFVETSKI